MGSCEPGCCAGSQAAIREPRSGPVDRVRATKPRLHASLGLRVYVTVSGSFPAEELGPRVCRGGPTSPCGVAHFRTLSRIAPSSGMSGSLLRQIRDYPGACAQRFDGVGPVARPVGRRITTWVTRSTIGAGLSWPTTCASRRSRLIVYASSPATIRAPGWHWPAAIRTLSKCRRVNGISWSAFGSPARRLRREPGRAFPSHGVKPGTEVLCSCSRRVRWLRPGFDRAQDRTARPTAGRSGVIRHSKHRKTRRSLSSMPDGNDARAHQNGWLRTAASSNEAGGGLRTSRRHGSAETPHAHLRSQANFAAVCGSGDHGHPSER